MFRNGGVADAYDICRLGDGRDYIRRRFESGIAPLCRLFLLVLTSRTLLILIDV
jgi:hypothetical protein